MFYYLSLLLTVVVLLAACTEDKPTPAPDLTTTATQTTGLRSTPVGIRSGRTDKNLSVDTSKLKKAVELDALLNAGKDSSTKTSNKSFYHDGSYGNYDYYDYSSYYDNYYYVYDSYESFDYYNDSYYDDYEYFGSYYNYQYRSSYYVWATYTWPSGYGSFTCYAQNWLGDIYYGFGYPASWAEDAALDACYAESGNCYSMGCW